MSLVTHIFTSSLAVISSLNTFEFHILPVGDPMEFEPLFAESDVDDVEVLPEEHTETQLWYGQSEIEIQIPVAQPIIPEESELDPLYIYPEGESFTSTYQ